MSSIFVLFYLLYRYYYSEFIASFAVLRVSILFILLICQFEKYLEIKTKLANICYCVLKGYSH